MDLDFTETGVQSSPLAARMSYFNSASTQSFKISSCHCASRYETLKEVRKAVYTEIVSQGTVSAQK